jgi:hypothetical protein
MGRSAVVFVIILKSDKPLSSYSSSASKRKMHILPGIFPLDAGFAFFRLRIEKKNIFSLIAHQTRASLFYHVCRENTIYCFSEWGRR